MTTPVKPKPIHALIGLTHVTDGVLGPILDSSLKGLLASANIYSKPPFDLAAYGNLINEYKASIPGALDGSRTAVAQKDKLRSAVIKMYKQLAHYVEAACNEDMATFMLSGFQPKPDKKTATPPMSDAIRKVEAGPNTSEMSVTLLKQKGATSHKIRWAPLTGGAPGTWTEMVVTRVKKPTIVTGLTPGTTYAFQARALTANGYTDWSDSVTFMCT